MKNRKRYISPEMGVYTISINSLLAGSGEPFNGNSADTRNVTSGGNAGNAASRQGGWMDDE